MPSTKQLLLVILVLWLLAYLVWTASNSAYVPTAVAGLVCLALFRRIRIPFSKQGWKLTLIGMGLLLALIRFCWPYTVDKSDGVLPIFITLLLADYLLLLQALMVFRQCTNGFLSSYLPSLGLLTLLCAFNRRIIQSEQPLYLALAITAVIACVALSGAVKPQRPRHSWSRRGLIVLMLFFSIICAWGFSSSLSATVARVQGLLPFWMARLERNTAAHRSYVRSGALTSIITEKQTDPTGVALRVYADRTPGYLRGLVYDSYGYAQWHIAGSREKWSVLRPLAQRPADLPKSDEQQSLFAIEPTARAPFVKMEIHNDPTRGKMYFSPLGASFLQGAGTFAILDDHQIVYGGLKTREPYTAYVGTSAEPRGFSDQLRSRLLTVPDRIEEQIGELAAEICRGAQTPQRKIKSVTTFFHENFEYAVEVSDLPPDVEPISHFLLNRLPAHCEFFASGAVMLLRSQQVPCRYVTGYVAAELESEYGDYWLARNQNAHAWAEAYDEVGRRWVVVEATPGMDVPTDLEISTGQRSSSAGESDRNEDRSAGGVRQSWLANSWRWLNTGLTYLVLVSGIVLSVAAYRTYRRRHGPKGADQRLVQMQRTLSRLEQRLRRRNLVRRPHETLHNFARRLRHAEIEDARLRGCADWYHQYARIRYAGEEVGDPLPNPPL